MSRMLTEDPARVHQQLHGSDGDSFSDFSNPRMDCRIWIRFCVSIEMIIIRT